MPISVKICGLTDEKAVNAVIEAGADYAGFVYFPRSPRHLELCAAGRLKSLLPKDVKSVSVLVDPDDALLQQVADEIGPDYVQLHGDESPDRIRAIREKFSTFRLIKAISVREEADVERALDYASCVDMLLFDAKPPLPPLPPGEGRGEGPSTSENLKGPHPNPLLEGEGTVLPGGNGLSFDWDLLTGRYFPVPWILSGGLDAGNVREAMARTGAAIVDVSSGVESAPGVKDAALIETFVKAAKDA